MAGNTLNFAKLSCGGNDFIILDYIQEHPPADSQLSALAKRLCSRHWGVGADGLIALKQSAGAPFAIKLKNADGSSAAVSYNGSRCVARYAVHSALAHGSFSFDSDAGQVRATVSGREVELRVPDPRRIEADIELQADGELIEASSIVAGVPYLVLFRDAIDEAATLGLAARLRRHERFVEGTNVALALSQSSGSFVARFFERGVEDETLSSGSGCVAVALLGALRCGRQEEVTVRTRGGDFVIRFKRRTDVFTEVSTSGSTTFICAGTVMPDLLPPETEYR